MISIFPTLTTLALEPDAVHVGAWGHLGVHVHGRVDLEALQDTPHHRARGAQQLVQGLEAQAVGRVGLGADHGSALGVMLLPVHPHEGGWTRGAEQRDQVVVEGLRVGVHVLHEVQRLHLGSTSSAWGEAGAGF